MATQERARNVADIRCEKDANGRKIPTFDANGDVIHEIYGRKPPEYAVYRACGRVMVHFADADTAAVRQRRHLASLAQLRDEIEGLVASWRNSDRGFFGLTNPDRLKAKAECQDRRVGGALIQALEDRLPCAQAVLEKVKTDLLNERIAWARFEYLLTAFATFLALMFVGWLLTLILPGTEGIAGMESRIRTAGVILLLLCGTGAAAIATAEHPKPAMRAGLLLLAAAIPIGAVLISPRMSMAPVDPLYEPALHVARGAIAGALGAFFSISLAIRKRTILPDLLRTSNMMDAVLRVTIGFIAGAVLTVLVKSEMIQFSFGPQGTKEGVLFVLTLGFVAGFAERLVPDLLEKANAKPLDPSATLIAVSTDATRDTRGTDHRPAKAQERPAEAANGEANGKRRRPHAPAGAAELPASLRPKPEPSDS
ncbi:hypothetical protein E2493_04480 [Sphingomonas parva]|uniref:Uncharacterized protein n=1 Tax=Sphingomonas parva TaxID=2555898 RepID=A0A4Y8ZTV2_9SPHN|nr:hypothetical protein [Sphingomonas parva]TFI59453.1 hypothetical protein E2493_04480 [Sphingomonas parva]